MYPEEISSIQLRCYLTTDLLTLIFIRVHACLLWCVFQGDSLKKKKKKCIYLLVYGRAESLLLHLGLSLAAGLVIVELSLVEEHRLYRACWIIEVLQ